MMKKTLAIGLTAAMCLSLTACGSSGDSTAASSSAAADTASTAETSADTADTADTASTSSAADAEDSGESLAAAATADLDWEKELVDKYGYELTGDDTQVWGYVHMGFTDEFTNQLKLSMMDYVEENYPNVTLNVGDGKVEVDTQIQLAENFITQGVDVMLLTTVDSAGCVPICQMCQDAGIPLVAVSSEPSCDDLDDHYFVGSDHYYSGQLEAEYLIDNVDDSETVNICYLGGTEGYTHTVLRRQGFYETLDNAGYNYKVLADLEGEYLRDRGMEITEDWITSFGDKINCIVAANDEMAMGALQALQAADMSGVTICGIDCNDDAKKAIESGDFGCSVFQNKKAQAKWAAIVSYAAGQGKEASDVDVPYELVTKENLADYE